MEFNELIENFAERHNVADLVAYGNAASLDIDGIIVTIVASGDKVILSADLGEPPAEGASLQTDAFFGKASESGDYIIVRRLTLQVLDVDAFDAALESVVNQTETWRRLLADYRPVAKAAAERAEAERSSFGSTGFMQV